MEEQMNTQVGVTWPEPQNVDDRKPEVGEGETPDAEACLKLICTKLKDPKFQAFDIMRLIVQAIASVVAQIYLLGCTAEGVPLRKRHAEEVKLLRALGKQVREGEALRRKEDTINFDGPKFHFVFKNFVDLLTQAMTQAGVDEDQVNNVLRHFRDLATENLPRIRRETEQVVS
jgi:hypothetical protein